MTRLQRLERAAYWVAGVLHGVGGPFVLVIPTLRHTTTFGWWACAAAGGGSCGIALFCFIELGRIARQERGA